MVHSIFMKDNSPVIDFLEFSSLQFRPGENNALLQEALLFIISFCFNITKQDLDNQIDHLVQSILIPALESPNEFVQA